jgi:hypothetical protein
LIDFKKIMINSFKSGFDIQAATGGGLVRQVALDLESPKCAGY